jgi:hypothetical protein
LQIYAYWISFLRIPFAGEEFLRSFALAFCFYF